MNARSTATALALVLGSLSAYAQDVSSGATTSTSAATNNSIMTAAPIPARAVALPGQFPVAQPSPPDLEVLAGNPGEPIGSKDLSNFEEPPAAKPQVNSNVMSKYEVRADRIPEFRVRDVYTTEGLIDYSFRSHPGLRVGNFRSSNSAQAYEMYLEDERLSNIADLTDTALAMTVGGDKKEGDEILKEERIAYLRDEHSDIQDTYDEAPKTQSGTPIVEDIERLQVNWLYVKF